MNARAGAATARLERLRGFLQADPSNVSLLAESADLALELGLGKDAQGWMERALAVRPDSPYLVARLASARIACGEPDRAIELLEPLLGAHPDEGALLYSYGYALFQAKRYEDAKAALAACANKPGAAAAARLLLSRALHFLGDLEGAIAQARQYAEEHPEDARGAGALSLLYVDNENWDQARLWTERALKAAPQNPDALLAAGSLALAGQDEERARGSFEEALKQRPESGRAWTGLGLAAMTKGDFIVARRHLECAAAALPGEVWTLNALAWCQILQQDYAAARATLERALAANRTRGDTFGTLAMLETFQGRWQQAEEHAKRARALNPASFGGRMVEVLRLQADGKPDLARRKFETGIRSAKAPGGGTFADALARMLKRPG